MSLEYSSNKVGSQIQTTFYLISIYTRYPCNIPTLPFDHGLSKASNSTSKSSQESKDCLERLFLFFGKRRDEYDFSPFFQSFFFFSSGYRLYHFWNDEEL